MPYKSTKWVLLFVQLFNNAARPTYRMFLLYAGVESSQLPTLKESRLITKRF